MMNTQATDQQRTMTQKPNQNAEKQSLVLKRMVKVLLFFLCLFAALAALGTLLSRMQYPGAAMCLEWGSKGVLGALSILGVLKFGQAYVKKKDPLLIRCTAASVGLLCFAGVVLVFGLYSEMLGVLDGGPMRVGLLSTASALVLTGSLKLWEGARVDVPAQE